MSAVIITWRTTLRKQLLPIFCRPGTLRSSPTLFFLSSDEACFPPSADQGNVIVMGPPDAYRSANTAPMLPAPSNVSNMAISLPLLCFTKAFHDKGRETWRRLGLGRERRPRDRNTSTCCAPTISTPQLSLHIIHYQLLFHHLHHTNNHTQYLESLCLFYESTFDPQSMGALNGNHL